MNRLVTGADGREWVLRSQLEWRRPATADDFEHDVAGGLGPAVAMIILTVLFCVALIVWMPDDVLVPGWLLPALALVVLFFPLRWVLRRPWTIVAETEGGLGDQLPAERWVGTIRGLFSVHGHVARVKKSIPRHALADFEGPLHPIE
jgi:hypothetical protein